MTCLKCKKGRLINVRTYQPGDKSYQEGMITRLKKCKCCGKRYITEQRLETVKVAVKSS